MTEKPSDFDIESVDPEVIENMDSAPIEMTDTHPPVLEEADDEAAEDPTGGELPPTEFPPDTDPDPIQTPTDLGAEDEVDEEETD